MGRPGGLALALLGMALWGGCIFKGSNADPYRCGSGGTCEDGLTCVDGVCVTATPSDGGSDSGSDSQPDGTIPDGTVPTDAQKDAPAQEDAAPGCVFDPLTADLGTFTAVLDGSSWQFGTAGYSQSLTDDLHTSWIPGAGGDAVSIQAQVTPVAQGRPNFDVPSGNFASLAGVIVRASNLTTTSTTGYFCGVDLRGQRLLLGRMSGAYSLTHGNLTILGQQAMTVSLNGAYLVKAEAAGGALSCSSGIVQVSANDGAIATGSVGLFTIGARARFSDAMYCLP